MTSVDTPPPDDPLDLTALVDRYNRDVEETVEELRERLIVVVTARLIAEDETAATAAFNELLDSIPPTMLADALGAALWYGGPAVEDVARDRLLRLRDTNYADHLMDDVPGRHRGEQR